MTVAAIKGSAEVREYKVRGCRQHRQTARRIGVPSTPSRTIPIQCHQRTQKVDAANVGAVIIRPHFIGRYRMAVADETAANEIHHAASINRGYVTEIVCQRPTTHTVEIHIV